MIRSGILILLFFIVAEKSSSQQKELQLGFTLGATKLIWGSPAAKSKIGMSRSLEFSFKYKHNKSGISFEPVLLLGRNAFLSRVNTDLKIKVLQSGLTLIPLCGIQLNKRLTLKMGLFGQTLVDASIDIVLTQNSGYYAFSNSDHYKNFYPTEFHAGWAGGISVALGEKKRSHFNLLVLQFVTTLFERPYVLTNFPTPFDNTEAFNASGRPSIVTAGFCFALSRKKENKEDKEE